MSSSAVHNRSAIVIPDSPAVKRQKTADGGYHSTTNSNGYDSAEDSGNDLFDGIQTTPVSKHFTQPTQIIDRTEQTDDPVESSPIVIDSDVQIPASSPIRAQESQNGNQKLPPQPAPNPAPLASSMAPAGTSFRTPHGIVRAPTVKPKAKPITIDVSDDDGPTFKGASPDDGGIAGVKIKPSSFATKIKEGAYKSKPSASNTETQTSSGNVRFSQIVQGAKYTAATAAQTTSEHANSMFDTKGHDPKATVVRAEPTTRTADSMSSGYGSRKFATQNRPARAMPVEQDYDLSNEKDPDMRRKIARLRALNPEAWTVIICRNALLKCKGNFDDAAEYLTRPADEETTPQRQKVEPTPQMRAQLKAPVASILDRYSSTQHDRKTSIPSSTTTPAAKPKRKLIQGRRDPSSPAQKQEPIVLSDNESHDSGIASESEEDLELGGRVLQFLNTCKASELADLANVSVKTAETMISARPFKSLDRAREFSDAPVLKSGKKSRKLPVGEKIVSVAIDMMTGYEAVDALVAKCEQLGKPLATEIAKWGFNVYGGSKDAGELEMTSLDTDDEQKDSAIGTPSSKATSTNGDAGDDDARPLKKARSTFLKKPEIMSKDITLKDYQLVGLNWLSLLYKHKLSCILADDMGLGKTCQVIAFLSHLIETGISGPHLVIVPPSTLENWLREFQQFSPDLVVVPYYGSQSERASVAENILEDRDNINVVVSTYEFAAKKDDNRFMRHLRPDVCVYDEGHVLKNPNSLKYQGLMRIPSKFRLLLTGTPLQNNLMELAALLAFILPNIFITKKDDLEYIFKHRATTRDNDHAALLSNQRIARARSMLTPFVLRRKKDQVLKHMPAKICRVEYCDMDPTQGEIYNGLKEKALERARLRLEGAKLPNDAENNPLMQLRKAAIHPMLFRRHFTDAKLNKMMPLLVRNEPEEFSQPKDKILMEMRLFSDFYLHLWCGLYPCISKFDCPDQAWMKSGKVAKLVELLKKYKENGDRVLIFSQFVLVLDILEAVLQTSLIQYTRFDGATKVNERQTLIDQFRDDDSITAFLLSTGAGGTGVNLMFANKVIIFDSSFNPQDDVQAENRAHRVGQTREVEVVRLVTKDTIEEQIYALGRSKLALDSKVAGSASEEGALKGEELVARMLVRGDTEVKAEDEKTVAIGADVGAGEKLPSRIEQDE